MQFTIRDFFWLCVVVAVWGSYSSGRDAQNLALSRGYVFAVANGGVKEYADTRGWGDLEMEAIDPNRRDQTPATAHDSTRWWYREVARKVVDSMK